MKMIKFLLSFLIVFVVSNSKAASMDLKSIVISPTKFKSMNLEQQVEYIKLVNQIMYSIEALQGPHEDVVAKTGPPFFLKFSSAEAADTLTDFVPGQMCLYGGHKSTVVKTSAGPKCPAPAGKACQAVSRAGKKVQGFSCNVYGLESTVCVPKNTPPDETLASLTKRCIDNVIPLIDNLKAAGKLDKEKIDKIAAGLKDFAERAEQGQLPFNQFCYAPGKDGELANKITRQRSECKAIQKLIGHVAGLIEKPAPAVNEPPVVVAKDCAKEPNCISCVLTEDLKMPEPDARYMNLLTVMAHRCKAQKGKLLDQASVQDFQIKALSSLGYCSQPELKIRPGVATEATDFEDAWMRKTRKGRGNTSSDFAFEKAFGMRPSDADKAFCGNLDNPTAMQETFNKAMRGNRGSGYESIDVNGKIKKMNFRDATGWAKCDAGIQLKQGRDILEGVSYDDALHITHEWDPAARPMSSDGKLLKPGYKLHKIKNPSSGRATVAAFSPTDSQYADSHNKLVEGLQKCSQDQTARPYKPSDWPKGGRGEP